MIEQRAAAGNEEVGVSRASRNEAEGQQNARQDDCNLVPPVELLGDLS